ncbi:hypothetical protein [Fimbriimonas ginsengisoli]|uniref:Two-component system sensor kinase n=1 Tax=Fimbriimonas ginsengisoli Gsoil 348 TaxID=661478 RepID=A0A068NLX2_FIMGI|nr:hypothetical protein [Fimbriimonas ginsengisoli]AIE84471.1 two-component system sensor kinase [Fimbriimonas ginsengisoli Gsoil 348]
MECSELASALRSLREGDLSVRLDDNDPAGQEYNRLVSQLAEMNGEIRRICNEIGVQGYFGGQAELPDLRGDWEALVKDVNLAGYNLTLQMRVIAKVAAAKAAGDMSMRITLPATGETQAAFDAINAIGSQPVPVA